jgi:heat-inducible transcriptional repressor
MRGDALGLAELNARSRDIFRQIVDTYLDTGAPVGSRYISQHLPLTLSPASVRNVMSDLEQLGLIYAPHTSAGRIPTDQGLRLFVDGLLEVGDLPEADRQAIKARLEARDRDSEAALTRTTEMLSGLSHCAGVVLASKSDKPVRHVEFLPLEPGQALTILVFEGGAVENRVIKTPKGLPSSVLIEAGNYLNAHFKGLTLAEGRDRLMAERDALRRELDELTARVVETGLADWAGGDVHKTLIVRGRANLLDDLDAVNDLERVRHLFDDMEQKEDLIQLLGLAEIAQGVRIFIGSESKLFSLSGSSIIAAPYRDSKHRIVGVLGIIGPTRLNYGRIVPMVDYTAQLMSRFIP